MASVKVSTNQELQNAVSSDPTLSPQQKQEVISALNDGSRLPKLLSGAAGAGVGVAIGKYFKLSTTSKTLLGIAGFGIGRLLYNVFSKQDRQFTTYNDRIKAYEMDSTRY